LIDQGVHTSRVDIIHSDTTNKIGHMRLEISGDISVLVLHLWFFGHPSWLLRKSRASARKPPDEGAAEYSTKG
jgi:hypothetical protein